MAQQIDGVHSPDRFWWWNGTEWTPAYSADQSLWFNGSTWQPTKPAPRVKMDGRPEALLVVIWIAWSVAGIAWSEVVIQTEGSSQSVVNWGVAVLAVGSPLLMVATGLRIALKRADSIGTFGGLIVGLCMLAYVIAMLSAPQPGGTEDDAAGAGIVILVIPTAAVVAVFLGLGFGIGTLMRRRSKRGLEVSAPT